MLILKNCKPKLDEVMPGNNITIHAVRTWALEGKIKSVCVGRRRLINFGSLLEFLDVGESTDQPGQYGKIRPIRA
jgi:hypothetical protein